jgi:hypothetical protein
VAMAMVLALALALGLVMSLQATALVIIMALALVISLACFLFPFLLPLPWAHCLSLLPKAPASSRASSEVPGLAGRTEVFLGTPRTFIGGHPPS